MKALRAADARKLEDVPNIGKAIADDLRGIGIAEPRDLVGKDGMELYQTLNKKTGVRHDPCVCDTFLAAVDFMNGGSPKPWWAFTGHRKQLLASEKSRLSKKIVALVKKPSDFLTAKGLITFLSTDAQAKLAEQSKLESPVKIGSTVPKATLKLLPKDVQAQLGLKDDKVVAAETVKGDADGLIARNTDIVVSKTAHYPYLAEVQDVLNGKKTIDKLSKSAQRPAGTAASEAQLTTGKVSKHNVTIFKDKAVDQQMSPMKWIALLKAAHMGIIYRLDEMVTACLSGHWVRLSTIEGDHAYPGSLISARFFYLFGPAYKKVHPDADPVADLPDVLKTSKGKPSKALLMMHYLDPANIVGMCETCNGSKNDNFLSWLVNNKYFGTGFVNTHFPLNYSTIVPRTKSGQGLGDVMLLHFVQSHEANQALNLRNALAADEIPIDGTSHTGKQLAKATTIVDDVAQTKLSDKELKQFRALLAKLST